MNHALRLRAAEAFRSAFRVAPEVAEEVRIGGGLGIYGWKTPEMDGFELPETDDLILALHLGGSRRVREVTDRGLSSTCSMPGLVTLLPPGRPVAFRTDGSVRLMTLHLPNAGVRAGPLARLTQVPAPRFAFRDAYVSAAMETMLRAARADRPPHPDYVLKVADALLLHLVQWADATLSEPRLAPPGDDTRMLGSASLREMLDYVDAHLGRKLSLDDLAARAGLGRAYFTRAFRSAVGASAHQYLMQRRVEAAKRMLRETGHDLAFIAQETGFSSQSHFTGLFRALTGCTPARFRDRH